MKNPVNNTTRPVDRRSFMKSGLLAGGAAAVGAGLLANGTSARAQERGRLIPGDAAILRFLAAAELIEADLWTQYAELGGIGNNPPIEVAPNQTMNTYQMALSNLDGDGPQYITSNTLDEVSHAAFINAYLESRGAEPVNLDQFRTLQGSTATGSSGIKRLTNLMNLNVDTSWFVRYRSTTNPDLGATFPQAVTLNGVTAIPRNNADFNGAPIGNNLLGNLHTQAIANVAAFHFGMIEQGGTSLYPAMAQRATSVQTLRILISIGPTETMHFQTWQDKAGNALPLTAKDPMTGVSVTFPDLNSKPFGGETFQTNLIMPEPCPFLSRKLPPCSIIRPTETKGIAGNVVSFLTAMGLFIGQPPAFFRLLHELAAEADAARRER